MYQLPLQGGGSHGARTQERTNLAGCISKADIWHYYRDSFSKIVNIQVLAARSVQINSSRVTGAGSVQFNVKAMTNACLISVADAERANLKHLPVVSGACAASRESARLHLLAVTGDGRRCYFSFNSYVPRYYNPSSLATLGPHDPTALRPQALVAVIARQALPQPTTAGSRSHLDGSRYWLLLVNLSCLCNTYMQPASTTRNCSYFTQPGITPCTCYQ
jgi:hypothetical protein